MRESRHADPHRRPRTTGGTHDTWLTEAMPRRGRARPAIGPIVNGEPQGFLMPPGSAHLGSLGELTELVRVLAPVYVRFSAGPQADRAIVSRDHESGCLLPGLSVNPMTPEPWWTRPLEHWAARQLCQYAHLMVDGRLPWLLTGEISGRGPDCEPLLVAVVPVASIHPSVVEEAVTVYRRAFDRGADGT